jgi:prepilin-type N-terminal cleavage/methylation domain-containing protein
MKKFKNGFTLIELLIVISVIGILTGVIISILNPSLFQGKAYDARRKAILSDIGTSAEAYYAEVGSYPLAVGSLTPYLKNTTWPADQPRTGDVYTGVYAATKFCAYTACASTATCGNTYLKYDSAQGKVIASATITCP